MLHFLPEEVLIEILSKLPVKSLIRFLSVSKTWRSIICHPTFISKQQNQTVLNTKSSHILFLPYGKNQNYKSKRIYSLHCCDNEPFGDKYVELECPLMISYNLSTIVSSCNGLICLSNDSPCFRRITLWNPSIRRYITLPTPCETHSSYMVALGFGFDPRSHDYKVVRIAYWDRRLNVSKAKAELYSLRMGSWRGIDVHAPLRLSRGSYITEQNIFLKGAVHWIVCTNHDVGHLNLILSFDMGEEVFSEVMLPKGLVGIDPSELSIVVFQDSISILECNYGRFLSIRGFTVWMMKEYGMTGSWTKLFSINPQDGFLRVLGFRKTGEVLLVKKKLINESTPDKFVMSTNNSWSEELVLYNPMTQRDRHVDTYCVIKRTFYISAYTENLHLLNEANCFKGGRRTMKRKHTYMI